MPRFQVRRSTKINASPERVFEAAADYANWTKWSPWLCAEPDAKVTVTDDPSSVGSVYAWKGEVVGEGEVEHLELQPGKLIRDEIRFVKPFRSQSDVGFEIEPDGEGASITWYMRGSLPWFLFWMRSQMEIYIGMDYERGLKMLKEWIETGEVLSKTTIRGTESVAPLKMAGVRKQCAFRDLGPSMQAAFGEATEKLSAIPQGISGPGISVYHSFDMKAQQVDYTSGFETGASDGALNGLSTWSIPEATQALCVEHIGSYENLGNGWSAAHQYVRYKKLKQSKLATFEIYRNCPPETPPAELKTDIYLPLR